MWLPPSLTRLKVFKLTQTGFHALNLNVLWNPGIRFLPPSHPVKRFTPYATSSSSSHTSTPSFLGPGFDLTSSYNLAGVVFLPCLKTLILSAQDFLCSYFVPKHIAHLDCYFLRVTLRETSFPKLRTLRFTEFPWSSIRIVKHLPLLEELEFNLYDLLLEPQNDKHITESLTSFAQNLARNLKFLRLPHSNLLVMTPEIALALPRSLHTLEWRIRLGRMDGLNNKELHRIAHNLPPYLSVLDVTPDLSLSLLYFHKRRLFGYGALSKPTLPHFAYRQRYLLLSIFFIVVACVVYFIVRDIQCIHY